MESPVKKTLKSENIQEQTTRKLEHYENMKAMHSRYRGRRRTPKNVLNKMMEKNIPQKMSIEVQEEQRTSNRQDQKINSPQHIIIKKTLNIENKHVILKTGRKKKSKRYIKVVPLEKKKT